MLRVLMDHLCALCFSNASHTDAIGAGLIDLLGFPGMCWRN